MAKRPLETAPQVEIAARADLRDWLAQHHGRPDGVWLVLWKKATPEKHLPIAEVIDECLCFGWVDSLVRRKDEQRSMLYISPRKPGSNWSRVNKDKIARLDAEGRMAEAGRAMVARAKADGTWTALDDVENLVVPPDLGAAFDDEPGSRDIWESWPRSVKRGALEILLNAKRPATRDKRVAEILRCARDGERPFQFPKR